MLEFVTICIRIGIGDFLGVARASLSKLNILFKVNKEKIKFLGVWYCYCAGLGMLAPTEHLYPPLFTLSGATGSPPVSFFSFSGAREFLWKTMRTQHLENLLLTSKKCVVYLNSLRWLPTVSSKVKSEIMQIWTSETVYGYFGKEWN